MTTKQTLQALEAQLLEDEAAAASLDGAADVCGPERETLAARLRDGAARIRRLVEMCRTFRVAAEINRQTIVESRR
jgi:hypothetical protein